MSGYNPTPRDQSTPNAQNGKSMSNNVNPIFAPAHKQPAVVQHSISGYSQPVTQYSAVPGSAQQPAIAPMSQSEMTAHLAAHTSAINNHAEILARHNTIISGANGAGQNEGASVPTLADVMAALHQVIGIQNQQAEQIEQLHDLVANISSDESEDNDTLNHQPRAPSPSKVQAPAGRPQRQAFQNTPGFTTSLSDAGKQGSRTNSAQPRHRAADPNEAVPMIAPNASGGKNYLPRL